MLHRSTRQSAVIGLIAAATLILAACGSSGSESSTSSDSTAKTSEPATTTAPKVVASTSWVGAVAKLAGATDITLIAPTNVQHPPDYDPKASDLAALSDADFILLAGFEGFADRMKEAAGSDAEVVTVTPDYDPAKLEPEVTKLAKMWGTTDIADKNFAEYKASYDDASTALQAKTKASAQTVVAQAYVAGWATFAGYEPVGTYGPEPTTPGQVADLTAMKPSLVFENSHMGGGDEIAASSGADLVPLVNFPGDDLELMPVVDTNVELITKAIGD